jgi:hypothetical protein
VIPPKLIVGTAVCRAQVEAFECGRVGTRAKCDADKPAGSGITTDARHASEVDVDGTVRELGTGQ